jgi:hypothetical protein
MSEESTAVTLYAVIISDRTRVDGSWAKVYQDGWVRFYPSEQLYEVEAKDEGKALKDEMVKTVVAAMAGYNPTVHYFPRFSDEVSVEGLLEWYESFMPIPVAAFATEESKCL